MKIKLRYKGGKGSGFRGHSGRPGQVGGSSVGTSLVPINIKLSPSVLIGRSWDGHIQDDDPKDPEWNSIAKAINTAKYSKNGKVFELSPELAKILAKDLMDFGEDQASTGSDPQVKAWGRASMVAAQHILDSLEDV
jgi:hypothetical protein